MSEKKYILFQYNAYEADGGMNDISGSFDTLEMAWKYARENKQDYNDIIDRDTWKTVGQIIVDLNGVYHEIRK